MYYQIIKELAKELNIKYSILSNNWIIKLEKDNQIKYITGYKFDLNSHASALSIDDKYAMYDILKESNIPVITHHLLYDENNLEPYAKKYNKKELAYSYLNKYNTIVVKSNNGTCGKEVYKINNKKELDYILNKLFKKYTSVSINPYYNIDSEYRIIILNNQIKLIYQKERPIIIGNGKDTITKLLKEFNPYYKYQIKEDYILKENEIYTYSWTHNLSKGARINLSIKEEEKYILSELAKKVAKELNINFGSIDIIKTNNKYLIMECNSGVMMDNLIKQLPNGYEIAKSIYKEAIINMFK